MQASGGPSAAPFCPAVKRIIAWCLFDFVNSAYSAYSAVIVATVFGIYYTTTIVGNERGLGDLWWGRVISASMIAVALTGPVLGALADRAGRRKQAFVAFTLLCIACVALFATIRPGMIVWGFALAALANFAFESAQIYYNAYLPDVAPPERLGTVSGLGFGIGYLGSIVGLLIALPLAAAHRLDLLGLAVAGFFAVFSLPAFLVLPPGHPRPAAFDLWRLARDVFGQPELRRFLLAYFVYLDGVETTIYFSGIFAAKTLGFTTPEVIKLFLAVQASALVGSLLLARPPAPATRQTSFASSLTSTFPCRAFETGQFCFADSAAFSNAAWSIPGTLPRVSSSILVILGAPSTISSVQEARVSTRVTGVPAFSRPAERAMLKHAACAAAISSSGFVPFEPPKRVPKLKGPLKAPLSALKVPFPSLSLPSQAALALLVGIVGSLC